MKIALLTDGIYPWVMGGMQKHSYYLARYMAKNGAKVSLFHCVGSEETIPQYDGADPKFFNAQELENIDFWCVHWPGKQGSLPGHYIRENRKYSELIWKQLQMRAEQYDIIYAQGFTGWQFLKARKSGKLNTPVLVNFHGLEMFQKAPSFRVKLEHLSLRPATKWNLVNADFVSSFGGKVTDILSNLGISSEKIIELPNGIEQKWIEKDGAKSDDGVRRFIFIGRYERRKGIEELHTALYQLIHDKSVKFEFNFVGPIPKKKQLQDNRIIYHGLIRDSEKVEAVLRKCDVLVCPSHSEGMPTVILEGMAKGLAIMATDVGAVEQLIDGNGWKMDLKNLDQLPELLVSVIQCDNRELELMKQKSIELVNGKFTWDKLAQETISKLKKIKTSIK